MKIKFFRQNWDGVCVLWCFCGGRCGKSGKSWNLWIFSEIWRFLKLFVDFSWFSKTLWKSLQFSKIPASPWLPVSSTNNSKMLTSLENQIQTISFNYSNKKNLKKIEKAHQTDFRNLHKIHKIFKSHEILYVIPKNFYFSKKANKKIFLSSCY